MEYYKEPSRFASNFFFSKIFRQVFFFRQVIFFWKFCLSSEPCIKSCFWCTNYPNVPVHTFQKRLGFIWGCFFPVSHCVKKCLYSELFWFVFSRIRTENGEIRCISLYSVRMWEDIDQNNSEYGHFLRSEYP